MFKIFKTLIIVIGIVLTFPSVARAEEYTSFSDLIETGEELDGKTVRISGEAIGEPMKRGNHTWINISDGSSAMGIWIKNEDADKVRTFGNYKYKGDIVKITGVFYRACSEHGGDMDIHAESLTVDSIGYNIEKPIDNSKVIASVVLSIVTLSLLGIYRIRRENKDC